LDSEDYWLRATRSVLAALAVLLLLSACVLPLPGRDALQGGWEARSPSGDHSTLTLLPDGTFEATAFPIAPIGPVPRSTNWAPVHDFVGSWSYDGHGTVLFDFDRTTVTGRYVGTAILVQGVPNLMLKFPFSSDDGTYVTFRKVD